MSIALMTEAFKTGLPSTQKLVLLALCDSANDQGECYPSVRALENKCSLSDRAVQKCISELEKAGFLSRILRNGRATLYSITPERGSPPNVVRPERRSHAPEQCSPPPPNNVHPTPERRSPRTIREPSIEPSPKRQRLRAEVVPVSALVAAGFDPATAAEFIACKAERKAPLTPRAWADHVREAAKAGWTPMAAAEKVMAKTWKGFEASYVESEIQRRGPVVVVEPAWKREQRERAQALGGHGAVKSKSEVIDVAAIEIR